MTVNKQKVLFYFTIAFPYEESEPFINSEFPWLCKNFDKIVIITGSGKRDGVSLPGNVKVHSLKEIIPGKSRIKFLLKNMLLFTRVLVPEFLHCKAKMFFLKNRRLYNGQLINSAICADFIKNHPDFSPDACFYSFWMNDHALTLALMKMKNQINRFVFRVHGYDLIRERWPHSFIIFQHTCHQYAAQIFTVSKKSLDYFKRTYRYADKAACAYLGSNDQGVNPQPSGDELVIVSCSNIIPLKRIHLIIDILRQVTCEVSWVHFGEGPLREEMELKARQLPSNIRVAFRGQVSQEELFAFYRATPVNYFINVSNSEGLPFSIMEACSFGIPVIATDVGGTSEIVNEKTGILLKEDFSTTEVAGYLNRAFGLPHHDSKFRNDIRKFWHEHFSSQVACLRFIDYLDAVFETAPFVSSSTRSYSGNIPASPGKIEIVDPATVGSSSGAHVTGCTRCILNTNDTIDINFDEKGVCNYCRYYDRVTGRHGTMQQRSAWINSKIREIKETGKSKSYDCILGVSGGVDSSYLAYWAKENGLRPLVVHFDNGWNSELAVENIRKICDVLGFSLQTYVINWEEFKQLQLAYLRAGVIDIEVLTDHAIMATIYRIAKKHGIRYTINGFNYATEAIMPKGWVFDKSDFTNIRDINRCFGTTRIRSFPHMTFIRRLWYAVFLKIESIQVLNYMEYNKEAAKQLLKDKLGWRDYGGKHYESVFTKFYQAYILPAKFGVDKRRAHLSTLICSGQITREQALEALETPLYEPATLKDEKEYVLKKFGLPEAEFERIMAEPPRLHTEFKTQQKLWKTYFKIIRMLRPWKKQAAA